MPIELNVVPDATGFGQSLATGRLVATVVSRRTGEHITVQAKCKRKDSGRWRLCAFDEASHVFLDTPTPDGADGYRIGTYYPDGKYAGKLWAANNVDPARLWAAEFVLRTANGETPSDQADVLLGTNCLACGRELTDPVSIEASIGPECRRKIGMDGASGSHHKLTGPGNTVREVHGGTVEVEVTRTEHGFDAVTQEQDAEQTTIPGLISLAPGQDPSEVLE